MQVSRRRRSCTQVRAHAQGRRACNVQRGQRGRHEGRTTTLIWPNWPLQPLLAEFFGW